MLGTRVVPFGLGSRFVAQSKSRGPWFGVRTDQPEKGLIMSRRTLFLFRWLHPLLLASRVSRLFQLTPSHIEEALALVALASITVAFIAVAFIVVQPYAVEWR